MIPRGLLKKIRQIEIRTNRLVSESVSGAYHSVFKGQGMNFDEVREYQPGDDVRAIDWNVTARMNEPYVKIFTEERELTVMLLVDRSGSGDVGMSPRTKTELAVEIGAMIAFSAITNTTIIRMLIAAGADPRFVHKLEGFGKGIGTLVQWRRALDNAALAQQRGALEHGHRRSQLK